MTKPNPPKDGDGRPWVLASSEKPRNDSLKDPKTAELPRSVGPIAYVKYGLIVQKEERYVNESNRAEKTGAK